VIHFTPFGLEILRLLHRPSRPAVFVEFNLQMLRCSRLDLRRSEEWPHDERAMVVSGRTAALRLVALSFGSGIGEVGAHGGWSSRQQISSSRTLGSLLAHVRGARFTGDSWRPLGQYRLRVLRSSILHPPNHDLVLLYLTEDHPSLEISHPLNHVRQSPLRQPCHQLSVLQTPC